MKWAQQTGTKLSPSFEFASNGIFGFTLSSKQVQTYESYKSHFI